jgi:beta-N-acetylhexosaminidase
VRLSTDPAARRRLALLGGAGLVALAVGLVAGAGSGGGGGDGTGASGRGAQARQAALQAVDRLSLRQQVGQLTISTFPGKRPPAYIRRRLRARETAGVILFRGNAGPEPEWRSLTRALQRNAHGEALVMVDQEGGSVRTVGWAGSMKGPPVQASPREVRDASRATARQLRRVGINVNLAPVADVPAGDATVMTPRAFSDDPADVAAKTRAAIEGIESAGLAATAKHFPGLGAATVNTDDGTATSTAELAPFRAAIAAGKPLIMLSHAVYPALDPTRIASQSRRIATGLLRRSLGYDGVAITDSIEAQAVLDSSNVAVGAERSIGAGADLILTTGSASWNAIYPRLLAKARRSREFRARVRRSAVRVLELKRRLGLS